MEMDDYFFRNSGFNPNPYNSVGESSLQYKMVEIDIKHIVSSFSFSFDPLYIHIILK